jgi:hypothetical protein
MTFGNFMGDGLTIHFSKDERGHVGMALVHASTRLKVKKI